MDKNNSELFVEPYTSINDQEEFVYWEDFLIYFYHKCNNEVIFLDFDDDIG
jgi:hypothetical protein